MKVGVVSLEVGVVAITTRYYRLWADMIFLDLVL